MASFPSYEELPPPPPKRKKKKKPPPPPLEVPQRRVTKAFLARKPVRSKDKSFSATSARLLAIIPD